MVQAKQDYQAALDAMTEAMRNRDSAAFLHQIDLPFVITTVDGSKTFVEPGEVRDSFERYLDELSERGIDGFERNCVAARQDSTGNLDGYHKTYLYSGDQLAKQPYTTRLVFKRHAQGGWINTRAESAVVSSDWPLLPQDAEPKRPAGIRDSNYAAFGIFQDLLNVVTQQYLTGDFQGLKGLVSYPLEMNSRVGPCVISNDEELDHDFRLYIKEFAIHGVTDIVRNVQAAEFIGTRQITGTYKTYILNHDRMIVDPYTSEMILELGADDVWRMSRINHSLGHLNWKRDEDSP